MTYEEIYRLKVMTEGQDKVDSLADAVRVQKAAVDAATAAAARQLFQSASLNKTLKEQTAILADLDRAYARATVQADKLFQKQMNAGKEEGKKKASFFSPQSLMQLGYAVDDVQYGIKGVANNIPGLLVAFGMGGGLAGVLSIVTTIAAQLYERWDKIQRAFGMGGTQTEAQAMDELAKATARTADETAKLERYKRRQAANDAQAGPTDTQQEQFGGVNDAIRNAGREDAIKGLVQLNRQRYVTLDPNAAAEQKRLDAINAKLANTPDQGPNRPGFTPAQRKNEEDKAAALNASIEKRVREAAIKDLTSAANDPDKLRSLLKTIIENPAAFGKNAQALATGLMGADPANQAGEKADRASVAKQLDAAKQAKKDAKDRADAVDADIASTDDADAENLRQFRKNRAKNLNAAKSSGVGGLIAEQLKGALMQGGVPAFTELGDKLKARLTDQFGANAASEVLKDAGADAQRSAIAEMLKDPVKRRNSQTIAAGDLSRTIQAGVGGENIAQKQLERLTKIEAAITASLELQKALNTKPKEPGRVVLEK